MEIKANIVNACNTSIRWRPAYARSSLETEVGRHCWAFITALHPKTTSAKRPTVSAPSSVIISDARTAGPSFNTLTSSTCILEVIGIPVWLSGVARGGQVGASAPGRQGLGVTNED